MGVELIHNPRFVFTVNRASNEVEYVLRFAVENSLRIYELLELGQYYKVEEFASFRRTFNVDNPVTFQSSLMSRTLSPHVLSRAHNTQQRSATIVSLCFGYVLFNLFYSQSIFFSRSKIPFSSSCCYHCCTDFFNLVLRQRDFCGFAF